MDANEVSRLREIAKKHAADGSCVTRYGLLPSRLALLDALDQTQKDLEEANAESKARMERCVTYRIERDAARQSVKDARADACTLLVEIRRRLPPFLHWQDIRARIATVLGDAP